MSAASFLELSIVDELARACRGAQGARPGIGHPRRAPFWEPGQRREWLVGREPDEAVRLGNAVRGTEPRALADVPMTAERGDQVAPARGVETPAVVGTRQPVLTVARGGHVARGQRREPVRAR